MLAAILLVGLALRLLALVHAQAIPQLHGDEGYYVEAALSIARGDGHPGSFRGPGFPFFMAPVLALTDASLTAVRVALIFVSLVTIAFVHAIARDRHGPRAAALAAAICALSPTLIHYTHFLWAETLFTTLLVAFFWLAGRYERALNPSVLMCAGFVLGLAALTKEVVVFFVLAAAGWAWLLGRARRRSAVPAVAGFLLCFFLAILPWTARNYRLHGRPVLISTCRWFPVAVGNITDNFAKSQAKARAPDRVRRELAAERYWRGVALAAIRDRQPWWIAEKAVDSMLRLFSPRTQLVRFMEQDWYPTSPAEARLLVLLENAGHFVWLGLGIAGMWLVPGDALKRLVVSFVLYNLAIHIVANAEARFLVPLLPLFFLQAGALLAGRAPLAGAPRWRLVGAAVSVGAFMLTGILRLWPAEQGWFE